VGDLSAVERRGSAPRAAGFTLIEILVVIVVAGIAAALIVANIGGDDARSAEREARRLAGALEHAAQVAQWRRENLGVSVEGAGYRFWHRNAADDQWLPVAGDDVLAARALPRGLAVSPLRYAGAPVAPDAVLPFRASGRNEPYEIAIVGASAQYRVIGDPLNRVSVAAAAAGVR